jgi:UDP-glucuronate decarboxylase
MAAKKIIVSGGAGFLGSHLVDRLLKRSDIARVLIVDNLWTGTLDNIAHLQTDRRAEFLQTDVEHFKSDERFDEVYHFASPASPPWYMAEPRRTISANVMGALALLEVLADDGVFAFASTSEVYGDPLVSPQPETYRGSVDCTGPRSSYDESKRCVEALLFETARVNGVRIKVVRLFNVYGPRTRPDDGRAVSNFITQAMDRTPITVFGDGRQSRSWGYVDDIIDGLERFFWLEGTDYPGPLNIGNDREIPVIEIARHVPQDPSNRRPDLTLARVIIPGWECKVRFEEGIARTVAWFEQQLERS